MPAAAWTSGVFRRSSLPRGMLQLQQDCRRRRPRLRYHYYSRLLSPSLSRTPRLTLETKERIEAAAAAAAGAKESNSCRAAPSRLGCRSFVSSSSSTAAGTPPRSGGGDGGGGGDSSKEGETVGGGEREGAAPPPEYDGTALAREVFAHPYFYDYKKGAPELYEEEREKIFAKETTVDDVRREYIDKPGGLLALARAIKASDLRLGAYFAAAVVTTEQALHKRSLAFGKVGELNNYEKIGAIDLPSLDELFREYPSPLGGPPTTQEQTRSNQLCIVTGSSGSGKTFFCLHYLTGFLRCEDDLTLTVYLQPLRLVSDPDVDDGTAIGRRAVRLIRDRIEEMIHRPVTDKLKMHVCLIFDEAGDLDLNGLFDNKTVLDDLYAHLKCHLAENVVMVVSGTGITGGEMSSSSGAYFFRLKPWSPDDLEELLSRRDTTIKLKLKEGENARTVVDAVVAQPKLRALTTNARSAYFLVEAIVNMCSGYVRDYWSVQLDAWAPALVSRVVHGYMFGNGIRDLSEGQRRLVAACVFRALDESEYDKTDLPQFPFLERKEKAVAVALLTYNVERQSNVTSRQLKLLHGENFAVSVTPAIAIVLFSMAGLQVSMVPGWRAEEEVAGLYAARCLILRCLERHLKEHGNLKLMTLERDLEGIRLFTLRKQIQSPKAIKNRKRVENEGEVHVPLVPKMTVLLNGEKSKFADVIAPYMLLQAKHTSDGVLRVNIEHELRKCCLLSDTVDDRVLRGVLAVWRGSFSFTAGKALGGVVQAYRKSSAYPENLVKYGTPVDPASYGTIKSSSTVVSLDGDKELNLPRFRTNERIAFVLVSNAEEIRLSPLGLKIKETMLNKDLRLDTSKMSKGQNKVWKSFLGSVKPGVSIKFLFTKSSS